MNKAEPPGGHHFRFEKRLFWVCCLIGLIVRLAILTAPIETILARHGSDDLFYFTRIAENLALGKGFSFDGVHPTTGAQPLFVLVLAPFGRLFANNPERALRTALGLICLLTLATALLLPRLTARLANQPGAARIGWLAGCFWLLHPRVLATTFHGAEAALTALFWVLAILLWARGPRGSRFYFGWGVVMGLGALARIDHLALAALLLLAPPPGESFRARCSFKIWRPTFCGLAVTLLPWFLFCLATTGSPFQDSGAAKHLHAERYFASKHGVPVAELSLLSKPVERIAEAGHHGIAALLSLAGTGAGLSKTTLIGLIILCFGVLGRALKARAPWFVSTTRRLVRALLPALIAGLMIVVAYLFYLHGVRAWYLTPLLLIQTLLAASLFTEFLGPIPSSFRGSATVIVLGAWLGFAHLETHLAPRFHWGDRYVEIAKELDDLTPAGARIGAFNAGIQGAWSRDKRVVVNLDGVVNHSALVALRENRLLEYLRSERIEFLVDHDQSLNFYATYAQPGFRRHLSLMRRFEIEGRPESWIGLWRVLPGVIRTGEDQGREKIGAALQGEPTSWRLGFRSEQHRLSIGGEVGSAVFEPN